MNSKAALDGTQEPCRVLVCDGEQRASLAVVRALGRRGHQVAVLSHESPCLAGVSRWARERFTVPNPLATTPGNAVDDHAVGSYVSAVRAAALAWRADVILPVTDQSNLALLGVRAMLAPAIVPGPTLDAFVRVSDKRAILAQAAAQGIAVPHQIVLNHPDADAPELRGIRYPVVIKPIRSIAGHARHGVTYAKNPDELRWRITSTPAEAFPLLLQQRVVGAGVGVFVFIHGGQVIATFAHERMREAPPSGGVSVYCRSIAMPPTVLDKAVQLLRSCDWEGPAMVEFKRETSSGEHYLMEINGRLWGSLQLAIDAGVDFPSLMVEAARGNVPLSPPPYLEGVRLRSWWGDLAHLAARLRYSAAVLDLPPDAPSRSSVLASFLRWTPREHSETFRWGDLAPFRFETAQFLSRRIRARMHGRFS